MGLVRERVVTIAGAVALAAGLGLLATDASADRGRHGGSSSGSRGHHFHSGPHHHFSSPRVVVAPAFAPRRYYYVPAPYYYYPPPAYFPPPVAYMPPVLPSMNSGYLYYCPSSQAYYPQVLECTTGWVQVAPGAPPG